MLDLFCGGGGSADGYYYGGIHSILGIDNEYIKQYTSIRSNTVQYKQLNAYKILTQRIDWIRENFDIIHASPPCQYYSPQSRQHSDYGSHADSISMVRELLKATGLPYIIENVESAPLLPNFTILLCGTMFYADGLRVIRHRKFESSKHIRLRQPLHISREDHPQVHSIDWRKKLSRQSHLVNPYTGYVTVTGGGQAPIAACRTAMGIDWMTRPQLNQAIPPPYTAYIAKQLIEQLTS